MYKPRHWLGFESLEEDRTRAEVAFLCGLHARCGARSAVASLPLDVAYCVLEVLRPPRSTTINAGITRVLRGRSDYACVGFADCQLVLSGEARGTWEQFVAALPAQHCALAVANFRYSVAGATRTKLVAVLWVPDKVGCKEKLSVCGARERILHRTFGDECPLQMRAKDRSDLSHLEVLAKINNQTGGPVQFAGEPW
eukprot:TRINITY_DN3906_c0_g1_i1.p1 TRINITY_DN3906_c0_g1~~TRINITY_DN3906_c0_g1_i1.p1  ORF type:complete len:197 (-),score=34.47 TRINITY_DN3906_c0_g1_i1:51-641(-)